MPQVKAFIDSSLLQNRIELQPHQSIVPRKIVLEFFLNAERIKRELFSEQYE